MPRVIWKGAITFGLVHVPVALYPASQESGISFDWIDKRTLDPVGYKRINKRTGKEIQREDIVKGIKQSSGDYVILSEEEVSKAYPKATQTIEIETFVKAGEISFPYLEKPYFLTPTGKGAKVYALLREAMIDADVIGIARVVMHTKERLAALMPFNGALMLNTIRWSHDLRSAEGLEFPPEGKSASGLKESELKMARQLIGDMTTKWKPDDFSDRFSDAIRELAAERVKAGDVAQVAPIEHEEGAAQASSNVVDLTELLKRSLKKKGSGSASDEDDDERPEMPAPAAKKTRASAKSVKGSAPPAKAARKSAATKTPARKRA